VEQATSLAELGVPSAREKAEQKPDFGEDDEEDDERDEFVMPKRRGAAVKKGSECPYLDTISRQVGINAPLNPQQTRECDSFGS
jgi:hypothetical protein